MPLLDALLTIAADHHPDKLTRFRENIPVEWVQQALEATGTATLRKRRLPAEQVVWLVIGMALYRDRPIEDVVRSLDLLLDPARGPLARSAAPQARAKLGEEPLQRLFEFTADAWSGESAEAYRWRGLTVYGIDGTTLRVADSAENRREVGRIAGYHGDATFWEMLDHILLTLFSPTGGN